MRRSIVRIVLCGLLAAAGLVADQRLADNFRTPPESAAAWVYWFWVDGNVSRAGIHADLEAMNRVGIRGVLIMAVAPGIPPGPVHFLSPKWRSLFQYAIQEATRLGIEVDMNDDGGWTGSAGPWITPELSMQMVVWSETHVQGPRRFPGTLPQPKTNKGYYRDIAVLAFPTPAAEDTRMAEASPKFSYGLENTVFDATNLIDGNAGTVATLPAPKPGQAQYLQIEFPQPYTAQALTLALDRNWRVDGRLEVSDDGRQFRTVRTFSVRWPVASVDFERVSARYYRIDFAYGNAFTAGIPLGEVELHAGRRIEGISGKASYISQKVFPAGPALSPAMTVRRDQIVNLTENLGKDGRLNWNVPSGKWTVLRLGHTTTGRVNHPAPQGSVGLECDKLSKKAIEVQFAGLMSKLLKDQSAVNGKALKLTHIDSWEVGSQNWTPRFREEFRARRGYDLLDYLPVLTGRAVVSQDVSERFLWDLRRTVADLLLENYAGHMRELSHRNGLTLSIEAYGGGPLDELAYGGRADMPVGEFWTGSEPNFSVKEMASSAHVYGRSIVGAEAFTARPGNGKWLNHPFRLKELGDRVFTLGINRFIFHRYAMQPWLNRKPGMTMGRWGIHFERTNTWWNQSKAWLKYLARCQYVLQQGQFRADVAYLGAESTPNTLPSRELLDPAMPAGYDYDGLPPEALLTRASVRDGRLALTGGMSYRVLVLRNGDTMRPELLRKIKELVAAGLTVVGPRPSRSPSLANYPASDREVQQLATELWGDCDGVSLTEHRFGKGKVVWGKPLRDVLREARTPPDFASLGVAVGEQVRYIHRTIGDSDVYFVANAEENAKTFLCSFRTRGKRPELWWPNTGRIEPVAIYDEQDYGTRIPIRLEPYGSVFVIFRGDATASPDRLISVTRDGVEITGLTATSGPDLKGKLAGIDVEQGATGYRVEVSRPGAYAFRSAANRTFTLHVGALPRPIEISGPWSVEFPKGWGAPEHITLARLISWTADSNPGVKYFSGTATYHRQFEIPAGMLGKGRKLYLDLGNVAVLADVRVNNHDLGILWKPPFSVDITNAARTGRNELEVRVTNLWPNRLIGDAQLPEDSKWKGPRLAGWPEWLLKDEASPTGRLTFTTWKHWHKNDPLLESGLLGPVTVRVAEQLHVARK